MKEQLKQALIDGNAGGVSDLTQTLLAVGTPACEILDGALLPAMEVVDELGDDGYGPNAGMALDRAKALTAQAATR